MEDAQGSVANRTSLTIAHRLTTVKNCDNILVFSRGQVAEEGSHESLLTKQDIYYRMWMVAQEC